MVTSLVVASIVETLTSFAEPWKRVYDDSKVLATFVVFAHLAALLVGGGLALAADRATLRAAGGEPEERERQLAALGLTHRVVIPALSLSFVTGVLLFLSDVETFAGSIIFWTKMGLVVLLLLNGLLMTRVESALRRANPVGAAATDAVLWQRLRLSAVMSGALWLITLLAGVALTNI
jgi:uncharacterized membrane protein